MAVPEKTDDLVALALRTGDAFAAAAVYAVATAAQRGKLEQVLFGERKNALMFARWEHTPAEVLLALSKMQDSAVKVRLDKNPGTPTQALSSLYGGDKQTALTGMIAQHRHAPASLLEEIAEFGTDRRSLKAVGGNPASTASAIRKLADRMTEFDADVAANPSTPPDVLEQIYRRGNAFVRAAVIAHPDCPVQVVDTAVNEREVVVLRQLARDPRIGPYVTGRLSCHEDAAVRRGVAGNANSTGALLKILAGDESSVVRRTVAGREDLPLSAMRKMVSDQDYWVRQWLGRNPRLPESLLQKLVRDSEADVRRAVARNPGCPLVMLKELASDQNAWVRAAVAYQANATPDLLKRLARDTEIDVLSGVASHSRSPQVLLQKLAQSPEADVRRGVILNRRAKRSTLLPLLQDPYYLHRLLLVGNHALVDEDRWGMHDDPDQSVRFTVFKWFSDRFLQKTQHQQDVVINGAI